MSNETSKMQSWQVFHYARKYLTRSRLYAIFGKKNARAVDFWCEDPRFTNKTEGAYDPLQGVKTLIDMLDDQGHCDVVRATFAFLSEGTSCETGGNPAIIDPLPTIHEEILADFRAVGLLQRAIESGAGIDEVKQYRQHAIAEVERTVARYIKDLAV